MVFSEYPKIEEVKKQLYETGARFALMTGTGSTLFGIYSDIETAKKAEIFFGEKYFSFLHLDK